jgi:S1 RNA binding domain protein
MEIRVGSILEGNVKSITKFGAFVVLPGGRSGLVHISEIAHSYVNDVSDHLQEGQEVKVKVVGIDEAGRINLSIKKAAPPPAPSASQNQGFRPAPRPSRNQYEPRPGGSQQTSGRATPPPRSPAAASAAPSNDFEFMMKQFMQNSDSKLSGMRLQEKRTSRRGGR